MLVRCRAWSEVRGTLALLIAALPFAACSAQGQANDNSAGNARNSQPEIQQWSASTPKSMPEDIFFGARDGIAWFSAESDDALGRFDFRTGKAGEIHLRPGSAPYAVVPHSGSGVQSTIYFTSEKGGFIGEFDPATRDVREFRMPGARLRIRDLSFDPNGTIWFTVLKADLPGYPQGGEIGRLNLFSSEITLTNVPTKSANPFSLAINSEGIPFFTELDSARLGSIDPVTKKITEFTLPNPAIGAANLTITSDDAIWYTDRARGYLGRFEPATGKFEEWPSPGGKQSMPFAIASHGKIIWYSETGSNPNKIVRFDSGTHEFQSWSVKENGEIRFINVDADGNLWFTQPQSNVLARLTVN